VALQVHSVDAVRRAQAGPESLPADFSAAVDLADLVTAACEADGASEPTAPGRAPAAQAKAEVALLGVRLAQTLQDEDAARDAHGAAMRAAQAAAAAYEALDPSLLTGRQLGRLAFVLLIGTDGLEHDDALTLLDRGLALLPPGVRAHERALLLDARAYRLAALERQEEAAAALDEAAVAATVAGETAMATSCTARAGGIHLDLDHPDEAAARLERAVAGLGVEDPATGAHRVPYGMYADLVLCLLRSGRALDAAEVAEGVARLLHEHPPTGDDPRHAFDAGRAAYLGARALRALDETDAAGRLAVTSADMHAMHDTVLARVEAIDLAATCASTPTERAALLGRAVELAAGEADVWFTADLRRRYADAVDDADGPDAALALLDALDADLRGLDVDGDDARQRGWHLAASGHLRGAVLLNAGRAEEAVAAVEPVAQSFGDVGDHDAAIRAVCLHVEALYRAGRTDAAAALGRGVADQALALDRAEHARAVGGTLARVLDDAGDPDGAQEVWERYGGTDDEE
jgi:tetratricopeptide (TPR) repeat protein